MTFDNNKISVAEGVSITIPSGVTVDIINGSTFQSCGNMWIGFIIEAGGTLTIDGNPTTSSEILLRDAQYGVNVGTDATLNCDHATFEHCYDGIYIPNDLSTNGSVAITGTSFKCTDCLTTDPLKNGYTGQTPMPNTVTFAGVEAYNATFNIGVAGADANHFTDIYNGAMLYGCSNVVINSDFKNIPFSQGVYYTAVGGLGIYSDMNNNGYLKQVGYGSLSPLLSFSNCFTGIYAMAGSVSVTQNNMDAVASGIEVGNVLVQNISIVDNAINATHDGIALTNNDYAGDVNVKQNVITVNGAGAIGISAWESLSASSNRKYFIDCNNITVTEGDYGILINAANNLNVEGNGVTLATTDYRSTGIALDGSQNCTLIENNVTGYDIDHHTAFLLNVATANTLVNNHSDNTTIGFDFWSDCGSPDGFRGNTMGRHNVGLHLNTSGIIGTQDQRGNKWTLYPSGQYGSGDGAVNNNSVNGGPGASIFIVHQTTTGNLYHPTNNWSIGVWFQYWPGTPFSATYGSICIPYAADDDEASRSANSLDTLIVNNGVTAVDFEPELRYMTQRDLKDKVNINDSLKNDNGLFENFNDTIDATSAGQLSNLKLPFTETDSSVFGIVLLDSLLNLSSDSLIWVDSLINVNRNQYNIVLRQNIVTSMQWLIHQIDSLANLFKLNLQSKYSNAKNLNSNIVYTNNIEQIETEVNDFRFTYSDIKLSGIPAQRIESLQYISTLCPFAYGSSVFRARSELKRLGIDTLVYDDKTNCMLLGYFRYAHSQSEVNESISLLAIPNPASNEVTIYFANPLIEHQILELTDAIGKSIAIIKVRKGTQSVQLDISQLLPALYTVHLSNKKKQNEYIKIAVIR